MSPKPQRLPAALIIGAVLGLLGTVAYATGLVDLPSPEHAVRQAAATLGPYTYALVGALALLETGAGAGLVLPGEIAVVLGGASAGQGQIGLPLLIAIVWACALTGDLISFLLARRLDRDFLVRHGPRVGVTEERLRRAEAFFARHGGKTIVLGRFVGFVRPLSPFIAGASNMPARRFVPCTALAAGVWSITFCTLGYVFSRSLDELIVVTGRVTLAVSAVAAVTLAAVALYRRRPRARAPAGQAQ